MFLTFQAKAVLCGIRKMAKNTQNHFVFSESFTDGETDLYCFETKAVYNYAKYKDEIDAIIDMLNDEKCIITDDSGNVPVYRLTELGMHPCQLNLKTFLNFLINSILVPVAVSAITTLITLWLMTR